MTRTMNQMRTAAKILLCLTAAAALGQQRGQNPFRAYDCAAEAGIRNHPAVVAQYVRDSVAGNSTPNLEPYCASGIHAGRMGVGEANWHVFVAELMKRTGDSRATERYRKAIEIDSDEAAFNLFLGDYLRNFRGPGEPLFPPSERAYLDASVILTKAGRIGRAWDGEVASRLARSRVALYQRDGLALVERRNGDPILFLTPGFRFARSSADLDRSSDTRDFTDAALFAAIDRRNNAPLNTAQLRSLIRTETPVDNFDRLRFRFGGAPVIDAYYHIRHTEDGAVLVYQPPFVFNRLQLDEWGISAEKPFTLGRGVDMVMQGGYQRSWRTGLIEYSRDGREKINQYTGKVALARFIGRDKVNVSLNYAWQRIAPSLPGAGQRNRQIIAPSASYSLYRNSTFREHFQTRGVDLFGGALLDRETYPAGGNLPYTVAYRRDYFGGIAARGLWGGLLDVSLQPTFFSSRAQPDQTGSKPYTPRFDSQYRTNVLMLYRIVDEEKQPSILGYDPTEPKRVTRLGFLHVVFPVTQDTPREGLAAFRNYKVGTGLDAMWYSIKRTPITFLGSIHYDFQRFYGLDKNLNLVSLSLSMGF